LSQQPEIFASTKLFQSRDCLALCPREPYAIDYI